MKWPLLSKRLMSLLVGSVVVLVSAGVLLAIADRQLAWLNCALILVGILLVLAASKAAHNTSAMMLAAVKEIPVSAPASVALPPAVVYEPGEPLDMLRRDIQRDMSSLLALHSVVSTTGAMPAPGGWAATPDTLLALVARILQAPRIGTILEIGSGTSSAWIGLALKQRGEGRLIALEHDEYFAAQTQTKLAELGLSDVVDIRCASLITREVEGTEALWFPENLYSDLGDISLLFVDGPPAHLGQRMRFPALPLLADRLADDAWVVLDDTDRPEEKEIVDLWLAKSWSGAHLEAHAHTDRATILRRAAR